MFVYVIVMWYVWIWDGLDISTAFEGGVASQKEMRKIPEKISGDK